MNAIRVHKFGGPEVLVLEKTDKPVPASDQVLIQVKAAGVNPVDGLIRQGFFGEGQFPYTPGTDAAGIIAALGDGKESKIFQVGDRVFSCEAGERLSGITGAYAEYAAVPARSVFPLAKSLSFSQGAALGMPYFTALRALLHKGKGKAGESILIHGASGSVGLAACQIAAAWKMNVIGTAGTDEGLKLVLANGASKAFNHRDKNHAQNLKEATGGKGFDLILEMAAPVNLGLDAEVLAFRGRIVIIGTPGEAKLNVLNLMLKEGSCVGVNLATASPAEWNELGQEIAKGIEQGWVRPVINQELPLEQAAEAQRLIADSKQGAKGKIVLTIA